MEVEEEEEGRGTGCMHCGCLPASWPHCAVLSFFAATEVCAVPGRGFGLMFAAWSFI